MRIDKISNFPKALNPLGKPWTHLRQRGVNEHGDEYSTERLSQSLQTQSDKPAQLILDNCLRDVQAFATEAGQLDDLTLIAVKHR